MPRYRKIDNSTLLHSVCAIVFILFTFIYLYFFQADLLFMVQHVLSGGTTHYNNIVGSVVIVILLCLLHTGVTKIGDFGGDWYALTYFPSLLFLAALTGVDSNFTSNPFNIVWLWLLPLLLVLYIGAVLLFRFGGYSGTSHTVSATTAGLVWRNLLLMAVMFITVCLCGNSNRVFHYRLRVERLLLSGDYTDALCVGEKSDHTDKSLMMLRIYALSKSRQLGEHLFEYPLSGGSSAMLPDGSDVRCLFYPEQRIFKTLSIRKKGKMSSMAYLLYIEKNGLAMKSVRDYILCGYLLDKNLDGFVNEIKRKYDVNSPSLPKHYKEALILYTHLRAAPSVIYHNEVMDADYSDFQELERKYVNRKERESYVRDMYGDTYWFYYFYVKP